MTEPGKERWARASFEAIAESIPHLVWLADGAGSTDYFNERGTGYTGLSRQANYGWKWVELVHPDDVGRARLGWEHSTRTATPFELCYRIRRSDGVFRWHGFRALPVRGEQGQIQRWIGTADDLEDAAGVEDDEARLGRQISQLRAMLEAVQPCETKRFGFAHLELRQARLDQMLDGADAPSPSRSPGPLTAADLTSRDLSVARLLATGYSNAEIANLLGLSVRSIEASRARLRQCLGVSTRAGIVRFAREFGLLELTSGEPQA
ncbi:MAG TPA: PAS domain-containing protein [Acidimicrobiia bacterium]|nr:PAS domain-containing protein [Acidimicrobiia bacterium]